MFLSVMVLILGLGAGAASAQDKLTINTTSAPPLANDSQTGYHDLLTIEAFKRIGIEVEIERLPAERSLKNLDGGIDDGTVVRIEGLEQLYPNLHRVPEPIMTWEFVAFARDVSIETSDWSNLAPHPVAFINGWKILEANVPKSGAVTKVKDAGQLFDLLLKDRTDVAIFERWQGLHILRNLGAEDVVMLRPPLANPPMYLYLHGQHASLIPDLSKVLKQMKEDGTYQKIFERTLSPYRSE